VILKLPLPLVPVLVLVVLALSLLLMLLQSLLLLLRRGRVPDAAVTAGQDRLLAPLALAAPPQPALPAPQPPQFCRKWTRQGKNLALTHRPGHPRCP
jgi:hypothetical protein